MGNSGGRFDSLSEETGTESETAEESCEEQMVMEAAREVKSGGVGPEPSMLSKCAAEFLGTYLLVTTVGCNVLNGDDGWNGVSIGCVLMVAIYALGGISGAAFNPAVSFAVFLTKPDFGVKTMLMYWASQIAGGLFAAVSFMHMYKGSIPVGPSAGYGMTHAGLCEFFYTFMLCFVILNVAVSKGLQGNQFYGLAIGFVIVAGAYGAGAVSGGCFNPAVAIALDTSSYGSGFGTSLKYALVELAGAATASALFRVVRPGDFEWPHTLAAPLVAEFLGTFFLVLTVGLNVLAASSAGAYSIAASLMCMIYALGDVSGAHFNPAVTVAVFASRRDESLSVGKALAYILTQIVAGMAATQAFTVIHGGFETMPLGPKDETSWYQVATAEIIYTFLLCFVVLTVAVSTTTKSTVMFGLAIGACVTIGGNSIGSISGGSLNPAVSFGIASVETAAKYSALEIVGALVAAGVFMVTHQVDETSHDEHEENE